MWCAPQGQTPPLLGVLGVLGQTPPLLQVSADCTPENHPSESRPGRLGLLGLLGLLGVVHTSEICAHVWLQVATRAIASVPRRYI